jgi:hypothetical protein
MAVRSTDECVAVENASYVLEVDLVFTQIACAFSRIPSDFANAREQFLHVFRHSEVPPEGGSDTFCIDRGSL